jgi:hypothetical protein
MEGYHWLQPQWNWNDKKLTPHIWQIPQNHTQTNPSFMQFWLMHG